MPKLRKLANLFSGQAILVFAATLFLGLWFTGIFSSYIVRFYVEETFTTQEAESLVGKSVINTAPKLGRPIGRVISYKKDNDGHVRIQVFFEKFGSVENQIIGFPKGGFEKYLEVVEN